MGLLALTGATGFIGGALAAGLIDAGWRVRALVRSPSKVETLNKLGVELVHGGLSDTGVLRSLVRGTDAVVHCAGAVRGITEEDFARVNVAGVARLVGVAAQMDRPPLFVSMSSLAAREPHLSPYAASKRAGEDALAQAADGMRWIALRPPAVYGPGDREMLPLLLSMMRGIAPVLGSSDARFSMLYVEDLVSAVQHCLIANDDRCGIFTLHDGHDGGYTWDDIVDAAVSVRGKPIRRVQFPKGLLYGLAKISSRWAILRGTAPMLTPGKFRELTHSDWVCDNTAFSRTFGWTPHVEFAEGLRRTLAWHESVKHNSGH